VPEPFDVLFETGGTTEPPAAFRLKVMEEVRAALLARDVQSGVQIQVRPADSERPRQRRRSQRGLRLTIGVAATVAMILALDVVREHPSRNNTGSSPAELPGNGWVAFTEANKDGDLDVYLGREGGTPRRIAGSDTDVSTQACPAFSPDGGRLVFGQVTGSKATGYEDDAELVVVKVGVDGSIGDTTTIPVAGLSAPPCPTWSPDGRWLAFGAESEVWLVDTATKDLRRVSGYAATDLDWRPGTDELAIADNGIHIYSLTTGKVRSLDVEGAAQLAWSPDGTRIAFAQLRTDPSGEARYVASLWLADADGSDQRQIGTYGVTHGVGPVWSPDGHYIAYQRDLVGGPGEAQEVVLADAEENDHKPARTTDTVIRPPTTPGSDRPAEWYPYSVTWSPDGSMLLYIAWNDACASIVPDVAVTIADEHLGDYVSAECAGRPEGSGVLAVPVDKTNAPVVIADASWVIGVRDGQPWLPTQSWGRVPGD
jgi:Tol biopolymer transport system component